ncbi:hypothetical protein PMIN07_012516 [Paraphaeosphaeria minitans]
MPPTRPSCLLPQSYPPFLANKAAPLPPRGTKPSFARSLPLILIYHLSSYYYLVAISLPPLAAVLLKPGQAPELACVRGPSAIFTPRRIASPATSSREPLPPPPWRVQGVR